MKITTEQLNKALKEAFGEIWVVEIYSGNKGFSEDKLLYSEYYNNKEEAMASFKEKANKIPILYSCLQCRQFTFE